MITLPNSKQESWRFVPFKRFEEFYFEKFVSQKPKFKVSKNFNFKEIDSIEKSISVNDDDYFSNTGLENSGSSLALTLNGHESTNFVEYYDEENLENKYSIFTEIKSCKNSENFFVYKNKLTGFINENILVKIEENSTLNFVLLENDLLNSFLISSLKFVLGKNAVLNFYSININSNFVRNYTKVDFTNTGGEVNLSGLYLANEEQFIENRIVINHKVPNCKSNVYYKGALQNNKINDLKVNDAHTVWVGDVIISPNATGTNTYEQNRNLLLTKGTKSDSVPNLEIYTGDIISAGHASTTAKFSEDQMFYLKSRGITEDAAKKLILRGFFKEILYKIQDKDLIDEIEIIIEKELVKN